MKNIAYIEDGVLTHNQVEKIIKKIRLKNEGARVIVISAGSFRADGRPLEIYATLRAERQKKAGADFVLGLPIASILGGSGKKNSSSAVLVNRLNCVDELIMTCYPQEKETAEECGQKLMACAEWTFQNDPKYLAVLKACQKRGIIFDQAQTAAIHECQPAMKGYLKYRENRKAIRIMDALHRLDYHPKLQFLDISDIRQEVHSELMESMEALVLLGQKNIRPTRKLMDEELAKDLKEKLKKDDLAWMEDIFGETREIREVISRNREFILGEALFSRILARVAGDMDYRRKKERQEDEEETSLKFSHVSEEWIEEAAGKNEASRLLFRLFFLRCILGITKEDMQINRSYCYVPYCHVLAGNIHAEGYEEISRASDLPFIDGAKEETKDYSNLIQIDQRALQMMQARG